MTVIHKECNAKIECDIEKAERLGMSPGDWGFCTKCGKRVDHLVYKDGEIAFSDEVEVIWD